MSEDACGDMYDALARIISYKSDEWNVNVYEVVGVTAMFLIGMVVAAFDVDGGEDGSTELDD